MHFVVGPPAPPRPPRSCVCGRRGSAAGGGRQPARHRRRRPAPAGRAGGRASGSGGDGTSTSGRRLLCCRVNVGRRTASPDQSWTRHRAAGMTAPEASASPATCACSPWGSESCTSRGATARPLAGGGMLRVHARLIHAIFPLALRPRWAHGCHRPGFRAAHLHDPVALIISRSARRSPAGACAQERVFTCFTRAGRQLADGVTSAGWWCRSAAPAGASDSGNGRTGNIEQGGSSVLRLAEECGGAQGTKTAQGRGLQGRSAKRATKGFVSRNQEAEQTLKRMWGLVKKQGLGGVGQ